jgi:hypothetical protein
MGLSKLSPRVPILVLVCSIVTIHADSQAHKIEGACRTSKHADKSVLVRNKSYVALERATEIRLVNGAAEVRTSGKSLVGRDESGRTVSVLFPDGEYNSGPNEKPLSIMISDPVLHRRIHENPRTRVATIVVDKNISGSRDNSEGCKGFPKAADETNSGLLSSGLALISTEKMPSREINGIAAIGIKKIFVPSVTSESSMVRIVAETWYSPELGINVLSTSFDPRVGDSITEITDIRRKPPDLRYFEIPDGYQITTASTVQ